VPVLARYNPRNAGASPRTTGWNRLNTGSTLDQTGWGCVDLTRSVGDQSEHLMGQISNGYKPVIATVLSQQTHCIVSPSPTVHHHSTASGCIVTKR